MTLDTYTAELRATLGRQCHLELSLLAQQAERLGGIEYALSEAGITGQQIESGDCPLSKYLKQALDADAVYVGWDDIVIFNSTVMPVRVRTPEWVAEWIGLFDLGRFPQLIEVPEDADERQTQRIAADADPLPGSDS